jgi:hypothetical protein
VGLKISDITILIIVSLKAAKEMFIIMQTSHQDSLLEMAGEQKWQNFSYISRTEKKDSRCDNKAQATWQPLLIIEQHSEPRPR